MISGVWVTNPDVLSEWVCSLITPRPIFTGCQGYAIYNDSALIAGVIYHTYRNGDLSINVASISPRFVTRGILCAVFSYPFKQLKCRRITSVVHCKNVRAIRFNERIGFSQEGVIRQGFSDGEDALLFGMLKHECRWLNE